MSIFTLVALITAGPAAAGLIVAVVIRLAQHRSHVPASARSRVATAVGTAAAIIISVIVSFWLAFPSSVFSLDSIEAYRAAFPLRFALPVVLGLVLVGLCWIGMPTATRADDDAPATPRVVRPWWVIALSILTAIIVIATVVLGVNSEPDANGRFVLHTMSLGSATSSSTIYGWYYSIPTIIGVAAVLVLTALLLTRASRRGNVFTAPLERRALRTHARTAVAAAAGALLLHLGMVLDDLGSLVLSLHVEFSEDQGAMMAGNPSSPLATTIGIGSTLALALGYAAWWLIIMSAFSRKRRSRDHDAQTGRSNRAPDS